MFEQSQSVYVSLAYRPPDSAEGRGGNWRVELFVRSQEAQDFDLSIELGLVKELLDHRCLWLDIAEFAQLPSTVERVTAFLANRLFRQVPRGPYQWSALTVHEDEQLACTARPDQVELVVQVKVANLTLQCRGKVLEDSGTVVSRRAITHEVKALFQETKSAADEQDLTVWSGRLFQRLKRGIPSLFALRIDLTRQQSLQVTT